MAIPFWNPTVRRSGMAATLTMVLLLSLLVPLRAAASTEILICRFVLGFQDIHDQVPQLVGECLNNELYDANGAVQNTTNGMMVWRKSDNFTAFTDGYRSWVNGPYGIQQRLNSERFAWERDPETPATPPLDSSYMESVVLVRANERDMFIVRKNGQGWVIEKGEGCLSLVGSAGGTVLVYSPGSFGAAGSKIIPPQGDECPISNAALIGL